MRGVFDRLAGKAGYQRALVGGLEPEFEPIYERCAPFTMTSKERMYAVWQAARYIDRAGIPGVYVECGTWRGGSSMVAALTSPGRDFWLYDTFEGMPKPVAQDGADAAARFQEEGAGWLAARRDDVEHNLLSTGLRAEHLHLVQGKVEDTIPNSMPNQVALLRLDTDWYESTIHELEHLWPRLQPGGVLIVDDYGHWEGARKAVDEYFKGTLLLSRIDYTGRMAVKRQI